jgi:Ca2+-binding RTX toxin-like protein
MGHQLGMPDLTAASDAHDLMYIDLVDGERRLPDARDVPVVGTAGNDIIDASHGGKTLIGSGGADNFVFANVTVGASSPPPLTHVADYHFGEGDTFDFSALTSALHFAKAMDDSLMVRAVEDASGTFATLQVNAYNPALGTKFGPSWVNVAQLDGAHAGDDVSVLIDSNTVHLAHLHVGLLV